MSQTVTSAEALQISRHAKDQRSEAHAQLLVDLGRLEKLRSNPKQALESPGAGAAADAQPQGRPKDPEVGAILAEMSNIKMWLDDLQGAERRRAPRSRSTRPCRRTIRIA